MRKNTGTVLRLLTRRNDKVSLSKKAIHGKATTGPNWNRGLGNLAEKRQGARNRLKNSSTAWKIGQHMGKEVHSRVIGEGIMDRLRKLDDVAYIRFASILSTPKRIWKRSKGGCRNSGLVKAATLFSLAMSLLAGAFSTGFPLVVSSLSPQQDFQIFHKTGSFCAVQNLDDS
ncbi:MAG: hypothetical protein U0519_05240 [Candidatus Gracilibacteria bacterium]